MDFNYSNCADSISVEVSDIIDFTLLCENDMLSFTKRTTDLLKSVFENNTNAKLDTTETFKSENVYTKNGEIYISLYDLSDDIIGILEDILSDNNIMIPDEGREGYEDEACIYGDSYTELQMVVMNIIYEWRSRT
ncbi:MAG: hypothetical protein J6U54_20390 [Clostridiales bacterium]|nr:hypothetical protein [Clostridiales bacterium]